MVEKEVTIIMQARMGSERLPGKVLKKLEDRTLLSHIIRRMNQSKLTKEIIVATSIEEIDNPIEKECISNGVKCFRGSNLDVLSRFYDAAKENNSKNVMRFCCDNPFADFEIADKIIALYNSGDYDYVNTEGFPLGVGVEIFPFYWLEKAFNEGKEPYHREHVTPYIIENANKKGILKSEKDYSNYRFTVDTKEDWEFAEEVYKKLYKENINFNYKDIIKLLKKEPDIMLINKDIKQKKVK